MNNLDYCNVNIMTLDSSDIGNWGNFNDSSSSIFDYGVSDDKNRIFNIIAILFAFIFIGASIFTTMTCTKCEPFLEYENSLDESQKNVYKNIIKERRNIYIVGTFLGLVLGGIYLYANSYELNNSVNAMVFVGIILTVQYFYYYLMPKSDYMITHMRSADQNKKWLQVYKFMLVRYHLGMLFGLIGFFIVGYLYGRY